MRRREFARLAAGFAAVPGVVSAQDRAATRKIGFVFGAPRQFADKLVDVIMSGVRDSAPANLPLEPVIFSVEGNYQQFGILTDELLARKVSVLLGDGPTHLKIAQAATRTVPIVAIDFEDDPVSAGYARGIARPGGNVTGIFLDLPDFAGKWMEFLRECLPRLSRVALFWEVSTGPTQLAALTKVANALNIQSDLFEIKVREDYAAAFAQARSRGADAAILLSTPLIPSMTRQLAEVALRERLPAITMFSDFVRNGGLLSYGPNLIVAMKQVGVLMGKVLSGTPPAELPIERPTKFELLVNQKTAQAFGLAVPLSILSRADEVIE